MDMVYVIGLVIAITQVLKKNFNIDKVYLPIVVFFLAGALNVLNVGVFNGFGDKMVLLDGLKRGFEVGAMSSGIYSMGKGYYEKFSTTNSLGKPEDE